MRLVTASEIDSAVSWIEMIDALGEAFRSSDIATPPRQVVHLEAAQDRSFISMLAFGADGRGCAKLIAVYPDNIHANIPAIQGAILLFSDRGTVVAQLDGASLTRRRTAAASALASRYLSNATSTTLTMLGTGALAPDLIAAHCCARPIRLVNIWGRNPSKSRALAARMSAELGICVRSCTEAELPDAVATADIVTCATNARSPILRGEWLSPGTFVDLVGSYLPSRRESDDEVVRRARLFVDTRDGAMSEAGDILQPLRRTIISAEAIEGELGDLVRGCVVGRIKADEITLFKSVGTAIEDFAASWFIFEKLAAQ